MSQPTDPQDDALRDRLIEQALRETLGGESPPDLSDKILAAVEKPSPLKSRQKERVMEQSKRRLINWLAYGTAGCLVVGVCYALLLPATQPARARQTTSKTLRLGVLQWWATRNPSRQLAEADPRRHPSHCPRRWGHRI